MEFSIAEVYRATCLDVDYFWQRWIEMHSYDELFEILQGGGEELLGAVSDEEARIIVDVLAHTPEPWVEANCMGILMYVRPGLHRFIERWTGSSFQKIRQVQENKVVCPTTSKMVDEFLSMAELLPSYSRPFIHYSKDREWAGRYKSGDVLKLSSFMGCAAEGSSFVHAKVPRVYFKSSSQVRYLGSLTTTPPEREVIVMPGSEFKVLHTDGVAIHVCDLD
ncbi:hypothetical protein [Pseudomonas putida]|uniref:NAD(+)--protein-arginine ADP-ribosyltransferase n=1 Tax=Pseudomonas putida TaxID=303 RepID=A0A2S3WBQ2_PSEPU|nr:hypothetical protein [Pseudomonas putida]POF88363.1 hypothetical protein BGP80_10465 [Pseudomonas putida]